MNTHSTTSNEGWIEWNGGVDVDDQPVPSGALVDVEFRGGVTSDACVADHFAWDHWGCGSDIIAYRVTRP